MRINTVLYLKVAKSINTVHKQLQVTSNFLCLLQ